MIEFFINCGLLTFLVLTALVLAKTKDLFASVMLMGVYSLLSALFFVLMDAVDVAFTEAAVGAGISTILMLATLTLTGKFSKPTSHKAGLAILVVLVTSVLLLYGIVDMPQFGAADAPIQQHVVPEYIEGSDVEFHIPNVVTTVLASYRGYDTFGETVVIFTAGIGVLGLLGFSRSEAKKYHNTEAPMKHHTILLVVSKLFIPLILLFALYVQFHGDYGPGGGFQAGVIFASAVILYAMIFGLGTARKVINQAWVRVLSAIGVLVYGSVGLVSLLSGKSFLDYTALSDDFAAGQHLGILLVELGVGITVTSVMIIIFFSFAGRVDKEEIRS